MMLACESSISLNPDSSSQDNGPRNNQDSQGPNVKVNEFEKEVFALVNNHRSAKGKNRLLWHDQATIEAQDHSQDMAAFRVTFSHIGFDSRINRIKAKDSDKILKTGENIAKNSSAQKAFNAWLLSSGHRRNIEGDFTHTGIGSIKSSNGSWYFTQIFLKK